MQEAKLNRQSSHDNTSFFNSLPNESVVAYARQRVFVEHVINTMRAAIEAANALDLEMILKTVAEAGAEKQQAIIYAIRHGKWRYHCIDPILTVLGGYQAGYQGLLLKVLLNAEWLCEGLKDHTYTNGVTALHIAHLYHNKEAISLLTSFGFNPLAQDNKGRTPRDYGNSQEGFYPELEFENGTLNEVKNRLKSDAQHSASCLII